MSSKTDFFILFYFVFFTPGVSERVPRPMCARAPEEAPLLQGEPAEMGPMTLFD
jgi:hypothetical protein